MYGDACDQFKNAKELDDKDWTHWSGLARCLQRLGELREAREAFKQALILNPNDLDLAKSKAACLIQLNEWKEAAEVYRVLEDRQPKDLPHRLRLAEIYLQPTPPDTEVRPEELEKSRSCLAKASKDFPEASIVLLRLAIVQRAAGKTDEYQVTLDRMFSLRDPTAETAYNVAWAVAFANTKDMTNRALGAVKLAENLANASPQNKNYGTTYGAVLYRAGKLEDAITQLQKQTRQVSRFYPPVARETHIDALGLLFLAMAQHGRHLGQTHLQVLAAQTVTSLTTPSLAYTTTQLLTVKRFQDAFALGRHQAEQARVTLESAVKMSERLKSGRNSDNANVSLNQVWNRLEFEILRREAESLINTTVLPKGATTRPPPRGSPGG
jgi:tetratricopeptide (TPR) repeat protein